MGGLGSELKTQIEGAGDLLMMQCNWVLYSLRFQFRKVPYEKDVRQGYLRIVRNSDCVSTSWLERVGGGYDG
jgi:hypothetical protein